MSSNSEYPKVCTHCGAHFIAKKISTQYCSHKCSQQAYKQKLKEKRIASAHQEIKDRNKPLLYKNEDFSEINNPSENNSSSLKQREFLSVAEVAKLIGTGKTTAYNYCVSGKLKCVKMNRKIFIRRSDIDELFNAAPNYEVTPRAVKPKPKKTPAVTEELIEIDESTPITEFIAAKEAALRYGVSKDSVHSIARSHKIPSVLYQGVKQYSLSHLDQYYQKADIYAHITEWYTVADIMDKYNVTKSTVYSLVSENKLPRKNDGGRNLYSQSHIDKLMEIRLGDQSITEWSTTEDLHERYGLTPKYVAGFVYTNQIPKRKYGGRSQYSTTHFDKAIEERNPPTVYLKVEDASIYFGVSTEKIHNLIKQHDIPKQKEGKYIRVQKLSLIKILNPQKLYTNGNN
ncbi:MAG: helix-turn-helix domain-containing protein [Rikenellaceae bacterium]